MEVAGESIIGQVTLRSQLNSALREIRDGGGERGKDVLDNSLCYKSQVKRSQVGNMLRTENVMAWSACKSLSEYEQAQRVKVGEIEMDFEGQQELPVEDTNEDQMIVNAGSYEAVSTYNGPYVDKMIEEMDQHWPMGKNYQNCLVSKLALYIL